jgi:type 1 glutamine amidotransferase
MSSRRIHTLIVTGLTDVHHDWKATTPALEALLEATGRFEVRVTEEFRGAGPETLADYDLVVLNYYGKRDPWGDDPEVRWGERAEEALYEFVRNGGGLVPYHATLSGGVGWSGEFERMCGGVMRAEISRRAPNNDFLVDIADTEHPITQGMPLQFPHYDDDLYVNLKWQPEGTYRVLATGWDNPLRYTQVPSQFHALPGMGEDHPVAWTVQYGAGRVFATCIGHAPKSIGHPGFRALFTRGAEWAATGDVTIPLPEGLGQPVEGGDWWPTVLEPQVRARFRRDPQPV